MHNGEAKYARPFVSDIFFRASLEKKVVDFGGSDSGKGFISSGGHLVGVDQVLVGRLLAEVALGLL